MKYGAISLESGRVQVQWKRSSDGDSVDQLDLEWVESGLPERPEPKREGFGHEMLLKSLPYDLGARTSITFTDDGLRFTMSLPLVPDVLAEEA